MRNSALKQESVQEGNAEVDTESTARSRELSAHTALLDLAPDAIFARDAERRITFWNRGAQSTYGFSPAEAVGLAPADLLRTEYPIALEEVERLVTETGSWEGSGPAHQGRPASGGGEPLGSTAGRGGPARGDPGGQPGHQRARYSWS